MQSGGQAARTGRRVISQRWGFLGDPLGSLGVGGLVWMGVGGRWSTWYGTYPGTYLGSSLPSFPSIATHSLPSYRHPASCSPLQIDGRAVRPSSPKLPKVRPSCRPKRAHPR